MRKIRFLIFVCIIFCLMMLPVRALSPSLPLKSLGTFNFGKDSNPYDLAVRGPHLFITCLSKGGFMVADISQNPLEPEFLNPSRTDSGMALSWFQWTIQLQGNLAFCACEPAGLVIVDLTNVNRPKILNKLRPPARPMMASYPGAYAGNDIGYLVEVIYAPDLINIQDCRVFVIDLSNCSRPQILSNVEVKSCTGGVVASGKYLYVATAHGIVTIDVANPANPRVVDELFCGFTSKLVAHDELLYAGGEKFKILSLKDPAKPKIIGSCETPCYRIFITEKYAFLASNYQGIGVVNITQPTDPRPDGFYKTVDRASGITADAKFVYVAAGLGGVQVFEIGKE